MKNQTLMTKQGKRPIININNSASNEDKPNLKLCTIKLENGQIVDQWVCPTNIVPVPKPKTSAAKVKQKLCHGGVL